MDVDEYSSATRDSALRLYTIHIVAQVAMDLSNFLMTTKETDSAIEFLRNGGHDLSHPSMITKTYPTALYHK